MQTNTVLQYYETNMIICIMVLVLPSHGSFCFDKAQCSRLTRRTVNFLMYLTSPYFILDRANFSISTLKLWWRNATNGKKKKCRESISIKEETTFSHALSNVIFLLRNGLWDSCIIMRINFYNPWSWINSVVQSTNPWIRRNYRKQMLRIILHGFKWGYELCRQNSSNEKAKYYFGRD